MNDAGQGRTLPDEERLDAANPTHFSEAAKVLRQAATKLGVEELHEAASVSTEEDGVAGGDTR